MGKLTFEHQSEEITADCGSAWQAIFGPQYDLCCESEDFPIDRSTNHCRNVIMLGHKGSGHYNVKARFSATLGDALVRMVDLTSPHERACSEMSTRACCAKRLRCFRNTSPSFASISRRRSRSANSCSAIRTSADRLRAEPTANLSRSFKVASSIVTAIVFILVIVSIVLSQFQYHKPFPRERVDKVTR